MVAVVVAVVSSSVDMAVRGCRTILCCAKYLWNDVVGGAAKASIWPRMEVDTNNTPAKAKNEKPTITLLFLVDRTIVIISRT